MQIAMGSPLGAANCISLPQGAANQSPIMERECEYGSVIHSNEWSACSNLSQFLLEKLSRRPCLNASILLWNTNNIMWIQQQGDTHRQFRERGWALNSAVPDPDYPKRFEHFLIFLCFVFFSAKILLITWEIWCWMMWFILYCNLSRMVDFHTAVVRWRELHVLQSPLAMAIACIVRHVSKVGVLFAPSKKPTFQNQSKASRHFAQPSILRFGEKTPKQKRTDKLKNNSRKTYYGKIISQTTETNCFIRLVS